MNISGNCLRRLFALTACPAKRRGRVLGKCLGAGQRIIERLNSLFSPFFVGIFVACAAECSEERLASAVPGTKRGERDANEIIASNKCFESMGAWRRERDGNSSPINIIPCDARAFRGAAAVAVNLSRHGFQLTVPTAGSDHNSSGVMKRLRRDYGVSGGRGEAHRSRAALARVDRRRPESAEKLQLPQLKRFDGSDPSARCLLALSPINRAEAKPSLHCSPRARQRHRRVFDSSFPSRLRNGFLGALPSARLFLACAAQQCAYVHQLAISILDYPTASLRLSAFPPILSVSFPNEFTTFCPSPSTPVTHSQRRRQRAPHS